jgi:hypothetical protein
VGLESDILSRFVHDLSRAGVAGEERLGKLLYLALTSRLLPWGKSGNRPVSVIAKGTSSTGKSHITQAVLAFFPPRAFLNIGSMTKRYLFYCEDELRHRIIYVPEWSAIAGDEEVVTALRTLLSEGRLLHGTVESEGKGEGRKKARPIEKEGPTGLIVTTTAAAVDPEMETRCLSVVTDDSPEQTRSIFRKVAELEDEDECPVDYEPWHQLQQWLAGEGETRVVIPFADALAELMPNEATRLRRDFVSLFCLIRAHAILHQPARERDAAGRIVASREDYAAVRELVSDLVAEGADATASDATRETVEAVRALLTEGGETVSVKALTDRLGVGRSATYDRVKRALAAGYLVNEAKRDERGYKLGLGASLPEQQPFLPKPEDVEAEFRLLSGRPTGKENASTMRVDTEFSGIPGVPADPQEPALSGGDS